MVSDTHGNIFFFESESARKSSIKKPKIDKEKKKKINNSNLNQ